LVWTGLLASLATFYAFFRWAGAFGIAGFLFNGGIAGFQFFKTFKFLDYQGDKTIAWKSIALSMFVTQRGLLYAIPAGLLLLWHWREKFFRGAPVAGVVDPGMQTTAFNEADYNRCPSGWSCPFTPQCRSSTFIHFWLSASFCSFFSFLNVFNN
jgi:hypothetical protein